MKQIKVIEKPETLSYDIIHELLYKAHEVNRKQGFIMSTSNLTGEQLKERIGENGKCWVAFDQDVPIGTISIRLVKRNQWYVKGEVPDYMLAGVIPEYQGKHVGSMLASAVFDYARKNHYPVVELDTAEDNKKAIEIYRHQGFQCVDYHAFKGVDHYSVVMVKWIDECPYSSFYCKVRYTLKRFLVKLRYKKGRIKRFGI